MKKTLRMPFVWKLYLYGKIEMGDVILEEGKYYQYPICCIKYYILRINKGKFKNTKTVTGTCFEPCPKCWDKGKVDVKNFSAVRKQNDHDWLVEEK